ncbi:MAG TPA: nucleotide exchange factor GrpE [Methanosphaera sp.]|jgi:molecular chaperone GrpE|nr:nucleotide exchange factor GrpE [Methanosphaera sp.]
MKDEKKIDNEEKEEVQEETTEEITEEVPEDTTEDLIKEQEEKISQYKDKMQRMQADFENYKKRSEKEKSEFVKYANEGLILKVLEAYEDLERALEVKEDKNLREGVELIYKKMTKILEDEGVEAIETEHQKFDPYKHEALMTENNEDYENNEIIQDLQKGYTLNSKVIRYSKVKVCKK